MDLAHLHTTISPILDGQDATKHVCAVPRYVNPSACCPALTPSLTLVNVAISFLIPNAPARASPTQPRSLAAISLLVFTSIVFRSEVALLLAPIVIHAMLFLVPPSRVLKAGIISATVSIGKEGRHSDALSPS